MKRYPFHTAYTQARDFYGVELTPIDFENIGLVAWDKIGNKEPVPVATVNVVSELDTPLANVVIALFATLKGI